MVEYSQIIKNTKNIKRGQKVKISPFYNIFTINSIIFFVEHIAIEGMPKITELP